MTLRRLGIAALLATLPWRVYTPVGEHEFLVYDDRFYVAENPDLRLGLSPEGITAVFSRARGSNWVPLSSLSWLVDVELHELSPGTTQLGNVLLHSLNVALLFLVLSSLTAGSGSRGAEARSAFVAAVLALHPVHVESVAWAVERRDSLAGLCWIATIAAYARYVRGPRSVSRYWPVPVGLGLGLLAKPTVVTLPFVLLLLDFWPLERFRNGRGSLRAAWLDKLPLLALVAASAAGTFYLQQSFGSISSDHPFGARLANAPGHFAAAVAAVGGSAAAGGGVDCGGTRAAPPARVLRGLVLVRGCAGAGDRTRARGRRGPGRSLPVPAAHRACDRARLDRARVPARAARGDGSGRGRGPGTRAARDSEFATGFDLAR